MFRMTPAPTSALQRLRGMKEATAEGLDRAAPVSTCSRRRRAASGRAVLVFFVDLALFTPTLPGPHVRGFQSPASSLAVGAWLTMVVASSEEPNPAATAATFGC